MRKTETDRERDRHRDREIDRGTDNERDRDRNFQREIEREKRNRERDVDRKNKQSHEEQVVITNKKNICIKYLNIMNMKNYRSKIKHRFPFTV